MVIPDGGIGQFAWSAPEVREGHGWSDKSDVYSVGHLLFRLLTGKVPAKGADPPKSPQEYASACPEDLASAIVRTLRVDPRERPCAVKLAETLRDVLETEEEALARVLAAARPADRPPLRLVPTGTHAAGWTDHPVPDDASSSETPPPPPPFETPPPPPLPTTSTAPARHRRVTLTAAIVVMALGLGWWAGTLSATKSGESPEIEAISRAMPSRSGSSPVPAALAPENDVMPATVIAPLLVVSAAERLIAAESTLTECARKAGRKVLVELKTSQDEARFTTLDIVGDERDGCARRVLEQIQFDPPGSAGTIVKEYRP